LLFELRQFSVILFSIAAVSENWYARGAHRQAAGHTRHTTNFCWRRRYPRRAREVTLGRMKFVEMNPMPDDSRLNPDNDSGRILEEVNHGCHG
jgi:hypothetical protein